MTEPRSVSVCLMNPGTARTTYVEGVLPWAFVKSSDVPIFKFEQSGFILWPIEDVGIHGVRCIGLATLKNEAPNLALLDRVVPLTVQEATALRPSWAPTDWVRDRIEGLVPKLRGKIQGPKDLPPMSFRLVPQVQLVEDHPLEQQWRIFGRCAEFPSLMIEGTARIRSGSDEIEIACSVLNSLAGTVDGDLDLIELEVVTSDLLYLDNGTGLGAGLPVQRPDPDHDTFPPMLECAVALTTRPVHLGTWQGIDFRGAILAMPNDVPINALLADSNPAVRDRVNNLVQRIAGKAWFVADYSGTSTGWLAHRFIPQIGREGMEARISVLSDELSKMENWLLRTQAGVMDSRPVGSTPNNNGSGDQNDFGLGKVVILQSPVMPLAIPRMLACVGEGLRPVHFRERDGSRVVKANHPQLVFWSQVPHWHRGVSVDQLGKEPGTPEWTSYWQGKDKQHLSSNLLAAAYAATGDPVLRSHIEDEIEAALLDVRDHVDSPRGQGRPLHMLANAWLLTGREDVLQEIATRVEQGFAQWQVANPWTEDLTRPVRPLGTLNDPRTLTRYDEQTQTKVPVPCWSVWEHGLAFEGYAAAVRVLRHARAVHGITAHIGAQEKAERLALEIGALLVTQGFFKAGQTWTLAANVRIEANPGAATPLELYQLGGTDGVMTEPGFWEWCIGAVSYFVEELPDACASKPGILGGYTPTMTVRAWDRAVEIVKADVLPVPKGSKAPSTRSYEWRRSSMIGAGINAIDAVAPTLRAALLVALGLHRDDGADVPKEPKE